jgi:hypothetical protein
VLSGSLSLLFIIGEDSSALLFLMSVAQHGTAAFGIRDTGTTEAVHLASALARSADLPASQEALSSSDQEACGLSSRKLKRQPL